MKSSLSLSSPFATCAFGVSPIPFLIVMYSNFKDAMAPLLLQVHSWQVFFIFTFLLVLYTNLFFQCQCWGGGGYFALRWRFSLNAC